MKPKLILPLLCCLGMVSAGLLTSTAAADDQLLTMTVKHADVAELFEMLSRQHHVNILLAPGVEGSVSVNLYNVTAPEAITAIATAAGFLVERKNNSYVIAKAAEAGKTIAGGLKQIKTFKIQYSDAAKLVEVVKKYLSPYGRADVLLDRKIIIIEDLPEFVHQTEQLLDQLDRAPVQILIEAQILDIKLDDERSLGVDWTKTTGNIKVGAKDFAGALTGGMFFTLMNKNIEVTLDALSKRDKITVLSTPKLLALEHENAEVIIGARTGYKTILSVPNGGGQLEQIQFLESGVILRVTPYVDRFGAIMMKIHPEVSSTDLGKDSIPVQATTEVTTRVLVADGQTVFIGGLIKNNMTNAHNGIPFLEDIPFIGRLFSGSNEKANTSETVVLIKPQIISPRTLPLVTGQSQNVEKFEQEIDEKAERIERFFKKKSDLWEIPVLPRK